MDFYSLNTDLVQALVTVFGLGVGSVVWAIIFCTGD